MVEPTPDSGVALSDAPLAEAVETLYRHALHFRAVRSLALFQTTPLGAPVLVGVAGDSRPATSRRLKTAAAAANSGLDSPYDGVFCWAIGSGGAFQGIVTCAADKKEQILDIPGFADFARVVLDGAVLRQKLAESRAREDAILGRLSAVYEIGQAMPTLPESDLLHLVCRKAAEVMHSQACSLLLKNPSNELIIAASHGLLPEVVRETRIPYGASVAWHVASTGEPVLLNEAPGREIGDLAIRTRPDIQSSMCVPLRAHGGRIIGVISIRRMKPAPAFEPEDLRLFTIFADQAALSIANSDLYASLTRRVHEMATVNRLTTAINSMLDLEYVLSQIADCIIDVVGFDRCIVYLTDYRQGLESRIVRGFQDGATYPEVIEENDGVVGLAASEQLVIFAQGEQIATASPVSDPEAAGSNAVIAAPIVVRRQTIGVIVADNRNTGRPVDPQQVELLTTFVNHAGLAIENSRLYEAMEQKYSELNVLYDLSRRIGSAYGLDNAVNLLLDVALQAVPYSSAAFLLADETRQSVTVRASKHLNVYAPADWVTAETPEASRLLTNLRDRRTVDAPATGKEPDEWQQAFAHLLETNPALMFTPLMAEERTIGVVALARAVEGSFSFNDVKLLSIIASNASLIIKNAITYERSMQEKVLELSALYEISRRISTAGSLGEALDSILAIVTDLVVCDECLIWTVDQESGQLELRASRWVGRSESADQRHPQVDAGLAAWALTERKAIVLPDIRQDSRFTAESLKSTRVRSLMSIPLMAEDEVVGVLSVHSYNPSFYTEEQVRILSVVASQAASIYRGLEALTALTSYTDNILTSVAAGVVTVDADGRIVSWNRAADAILDLSTRQAMGTSFTDVLRDLSQDAGALAPVMDAIEKIQGGAPSERGIEITARAGADNDLYLMFSISQLRDNAGDPLGLVFIFEDVTRQVQMQQEVRRMEELAAIGQLAASIAHELRNPLSSIKGAAQFLQQESEDASTREFLGIIIEEVDGLNKIATDFLDFARPLRVEATDVSIADLLQKQVSLVRHQLENAGIKQKISVEDSLPTVRADQKQLEQVLLNLLLNSIQAMPEGGTLDVCARQSPRWPEHIEVSVRDSGSGITPDRLGKIFTPFFTTKVKGTGLGLPVVQKIVQNHHGHMEVDSREGEGTVFRIHLPTAGPRPSMLPEGSSVTPDLLERT